MRRLTLAAAALLLLPATAGAAERSACFPAKSRTVARSEHVRVFETAGPDGAVHGCIFSRGRAFALTGRDDAGLVSRLNGPMALAGPFFAFSEEYLGADGAESFFHVTVVDLRSGRPVHSGEAFPSDLPRSRTIPTALLLRRTGGVAWFTEGQEIERPRIIQVVMRADSRGRKVLASSHDLTELRFCDRVRVCWKQAGVWQRASLR